MKKIAILGAGSCGTALAIALGRSRHRTGFRLWVHGADVLAVASRPAAKIRSTCRAHVCPMRVEITERYGRSPGGRGHVVGAIPSAHARTVYTRNGAASGRRHRRAEALIFVSATKGSENDSLLRMSRSRERRARKNAASRRTLSAHRGSRRFPDRALRSK